LFTENGSYAGERYPLDEKSGASGTATYVGIAERDRLAIFETTLP